jgi:hypothetical protein
MIFRKVTLNRIQLPQTKRLTSKDFRLYHKHAACTCSRIRDNRQYIQIYNL